MTQDQKDLAENVLDFVVVPLAAIALVDALLFPQTELLFESVQPFLGWIVAAGFAVLACKWARTKRAFK